MMLGDDNIKTCTLCLHDAGILCSHHRKLAAQIAKKKQRHETMKMRSEKRWNTH